MRKLIMITAAMLFAVVTQAAVFNWGTEWVYSTDWDNGTAEGTVWLVWVNESYSHGASYDNGGIDYHVSEGLRVGGSGNQVISFAPVAYGGLDGAPTINMSAAEWNGRQLVLVGYDSDQSKWGVSDVYTISGLSDVPAPNVITHGTFGNDIDSYLHLGYDPIPEPTSFALLGLGVAALALRRRISK